MTAIDIKSFKALPQKRHVLHSFSFVIAIILLIASSPSALAADCTKLFQDHLRADINTTYEEFDQTPGAGYRQLADIGCQSEAADLIEIYIERNQAPQMILKWHVAQLRAKSGDYRAAIKSARSTIREDEDLNKTQMRWNDYVLATISFLERDRQHFILYRNRVALGSDFWPNAKNLKFLDGLVAHFDENYLDATSHLDNN